ncbi:hypothetical protein EIP86_007827 [Pleurotus ostreatoroseus]|nr:hypothetical protein EIP86_007827 [Pleurotus ostreatoroseus]
MLPSILVSLITLLGVLAASATVVERQGVITQPTTLHALTVGGTDLGALFAGGSVVTVSTTAPGNLFALDPLTDTLNLQTLSDIFPPPHAFLEFPTATTGCEATAPLVFTLATNDTCAVSTGWSFEALLLKAPVPGTFEVCSGEVFFVAAPTPTVSTNCTQVEIVKGPTTTPS